MPDHTPTSTAPGLRATLLAALGRDALGRRADNATLTELAEDLAAERDQARADLEAARGRCQHLRRELDAMTRLHDQRHRDWQRADNARQQLLTERANLRADLQRAHRDLDRWARVVDTAGTWRQGRGGGGMTYHRACVALAAAVDALTAEPAAPVPAPSAPEPGLTRCCAHPQCYRTFQADVGPKERGWYRLRGLTVLCPDHPLAETAAPPAVDHAEPPADPAGGARTDEAGPEAQGGAEAVARWRCTDIDGDSLRATRSPGGGIILDCGRPGTRGAVQLDPDAAADLHAWLSQQLGQPAPAPGPQEAAETATLWRCTDPDGDHVEIMPRDSGPGWIIVASPGGTYLTPDAADSLHTWLGQHLGHRDDQDDEQDATPEPTPGPQEAAETGGATDPEWAALITAGATGGRTGMDAVCDAYSRGIHVGIQRATTRIRHEADTTAHPAEAAHDYLHYAADIAHNTTPATPTPGPQDIPQEWMLPLLRQADDIEGLDVGEHELLDHHRTEGYRHAIRSAYRIGYAAALGYEITVEDDLVLIGDRAEEHQPPTEEDDWAAPDHAMIPAIARALFGDGAAVGTPVCAHCYRKIHHDGRRWRHTTTQAASCPEATPS